MFKLKRRKTEEKNQPPPKETPAWFRRLSLIGAGKERLYFVENFTMLVSAGMDLIASLDAIKQGVRTSTMKKLLTLMQFDIEAGATLSVAMRRTGLFAPHIIALIRTGEEGGTLVENLQVIVEQQHKDQLFKSKLRSASMYPLFVLGLALVLGLGIAWFILPRLSSVFTGLNIKLPLITRLLMQLGDFMKLHGVIAVPAMLAGMLAVGYFIFIFPKTNFIGQWLLFQFPGINTLLKEVELSRFGYILGTLLKAGLPITSALNTLADASVFSRYKRLYHYLRDRIEEGDSFQEAFRSFRHSGKLIPVPIQQMVVAGAQSGRLARTILDIGAVFEDKTETTTKNISVVLEPVLLVFVWLGVVAVALSVILPIYSLIGGLSQGNQNSTPESSAVVELPAVLDTTSTIILSAVEQKNQSNLGQVVITPFGAKQANARAEPSTKAALVSKLTSGSEFFYIKKQPAWYQIALTGSSTAWVYYRNVREIK